MNNDAANTLKHYAPGMYSVLADIVMKTFLFGAFVRALLPDMHKVEYRFILGCLTVLSTVSVCHLV